MHTPEEAFPGLVRGGPPWRRSQLLVILERPDPAPWSLRKVAWLARRLGADLVLAVILTYNRSPDDFDRFKVRMTKDDVQRVTARLDHQGLWAAGEVLLVARGAEARSASDLADRLDPDLVIVLARRGARLGVFPGSPLAHDLMRRRQRPVLVIPDHVRRATWIGVLLRFVGVRAPFEYTER